MSGHTIYHDDENDFVSVTQGVEIVGVDLSGGNDIFNGGDGVDLVNGGTGQDFISGGDGADALGGGADNDTLQGGGGNDFIDGGKGIDIAKYTGLYSEYIFSFNEERLLNVSDSVADRDGSDILGNIEIVEFADQQVFVSSLSGGPNSAPTGLNISTTAFDENITTGTGIATLSSTDPDSNDTFTYSLVRGTGDNDNDAFTIEGAQLKIKTTPDHETKPSYSIRVRTTDSGNLSYEKNLELTVNDLEEKRLSEIQQIKPANESITYRPGTSVSLPLVYSTSDSDIGLSGLGLNIHHDSKRLMPSTPNNGITDQLQADSVTATTFVPDTTDLDGSELTDQIIQLTWASVDNSFPGTSLPAQVAVANFNTNSDAYDPVNGAPINTTINFTASETASNYGFEGTPVTLTPESFHLDIDGDGRTTALGDGLMVIRKLFGTAFAGDALTNKAASANAAVDTEAMHHWLEAGIASGDLDVDKDGKTTALGDGLMVIRHMFGSAFAGDALIEKAISNSSPYAGQSNAAEMVSANIDSLMNLA